MATDISPNIAADIPFNTAFDVSTDIPMNSALNISLDVTPNIGIDLQDPKPSIDKAKGDKLIDFLNFRHDL